MEEEKKKQEEIKKTEDAKKKEDGIKKMEEKQKNPDSSSSSSEESDSSEEDVKKKDSNKKEPKMEEKAKMKEEKKDEAKKKDSSSSSSEESESEDEKKKTESKKEKQKEDVPKENMEKKKTEKKKKKKKKKEEKKDSSESEDSIKKEEPKVREPIKRRESWIHASSSEDDLPVEPETPKSPKMSYHEPNRPKDLNMVKEGYLEKKGVIRRNWTRRWMVLIKNKEIRLYKNEKDLLPKSVIPLKNASIYPHVHLKHVQMPVYFNLRVGNRDFLMRAVDLEEKKAWVKAIRANIVEDKDNQMKVGKLTAFLGVVKNPEEIK